MRWRSTSVSLVFEYGVPFVPDGQLPAAKVCYRRVTGWIMLIPSFTTSFVAGQIDELCGTGVFGLEGARHKEGRPVVRMFERTERRVLKDEPAP